MTLLLILSAFGLAWAAALAAERLLEILRRKRREVQVRALMERIPSRNGSFLERSARYFETALARFLGIPQLADYRSMVETLLRRSGRDKITTVARFCGMQTSAAIVGALLFGMGGGALGLGVGLLGGFALPLLMLSDEARRREGRILRELPDALEGFSLCVEAGLTLDQAWAHYLTDASPHPWREELSAVVRQVQAGSSRKEALGEMSRRLDLTDVSLFTSSVSHAEKTGTGIGGTLRRLAATLRDKQAQRAEKAVQELPVKLLLPLLLCIMPVTLLVLFAPILLKLIYG